MFQLIIGVMDLGSPDERHVVHVEMKGADTALIEATSRLMMYASDTLYDCELHLLADGGIAGGHIASDSYLAPMRSEADVDRTAGWLASFHPDRPSRDSYAALLQEMEGGRA